MAVKVLMVTAGWPSADHPNSGRFVEQQVRFLRGAGVVVDVLSFRGNKSLRKYLHAWRQVRERLHGESYDLIHAQWGQAGLLAVPKRLPLVITFRGSDLQGVLLGSDGRPTRLGRMLTWISKAVALHADAVIVVSRALGSLLPRSCRFEVIPSGLDLDRFQPRPKLAARRELRLPDDRYLVLFGGDPALPVKRVWLAQEAIKRVRTDLPAELLTIRAESPDTVAAYMNACDALLVTSSFEGSPNMVKEALASTLPVVSVDVGDVRERYGQLAGCLFCLDETPDAIARALENTLVRSPSHGSREAVEDLDEVKLTRRVIDVYRSVLARFGRSPGL